MRIRIETPDEHESVDAIHDSAFGGPDEAQLVRGVRSTAILSLVAEVGGAPVGHLLFTPLPLRRGDEQVHAAALAPLAVLPGHQRRGIGTALMQEGLRRLGGCPAVIVLGDPLYYGRFGFTPAAAFGVSGQYSGAGEAFMALELSDGALAGGGWRTEYPAAFDGV